MALSVSATDPTALVRSICHYKGQKVKLHNFLSSFGAEGKGSSAPTYLDAIRALHEERSRKLVINIDDIFGFFGYKGGAYKFNPMNSDKATDLLNTLITNTKRSLGLLYEVVEEIRRQNFGEAIGAGGDDLLSLPAKRIMLADSLPMSFRVPYQVSLAPSQRAPILPLHLLRAEHIGAYTCFEGVVSKITNVKPCLAVAAYKCESCGSWAFQHIEGNFFTPLRRCESTECKTERRWDTMTLSIRDSRFIKRQEAKVQEMPHNVPPGTIPRQVRCVLYEEMTQVLRPGMSVLVGGILSPILENGWTHPKAKQATDSIMEVHFVKAHRSSFETASKDADDESFKEIIRTGNLYELLAKSLAPAIHGHDDVKKALVLQLIGGSTETFGDGLKIRGDIHMLLMGDPGIAKSQLLLRVCSVAPRAHFTCGKGASGVGLTASVLRDPVTGEFSLEGGAIVMADNGICCVDEFDKMQESDRTAIHEVMEQQTVSISKAGLVATLNARTTILAAANPIYGRYDITQSAVTNIGLPAALLSRFDVVFLLLDQGGDYQSDLKLAKYLLKVHQNSSAGNQAPEQANDPGSRHLSNSEMRTLIGRAKQYSPRLSDELAELVVEEYVNMRAKDRSDEVEDAYTTPRTLFGILRLSQALARLRFTDKIEESDFREALRLMESSRKSVVGVKEQKLDEELGMEKTTSTVLTLLQTLQKEASEREYKAKGRARRAVARGVPRGAWILLEEACRRADDISIQAFQVEEILENLVHTGVVKWNGPTKVAFIFVEQLVRDAVDQDSD